MADCPEVIYVYCRGNSVRQHIRVLKSRYSQEYKPNEDRAPSKTETPRTRCGLSEITLSLRFDYSRSLVFYTIPIHLYGVPFCSSHLSLVTWVSNHPFRNNIQACCPYHKHTQPKPTNNSSTYTFLLAFTACAYCVIDTLKSQRIPRVMMMMMMISPAHIFC